MGYWKKHTRKDLQSLLELLDSHGWTIIDPPTYYRVRCPCGHHQRSIHLTPSDPNYPLNAEKWCRRQPCWKEEP